MAKKKAVKIGRPRGEVDPNSTPAKIKAAREKAGLSVADMADKLGLGLAAAYNLESGHTDPSLALRRIAAALGVDPRKLL